MNSSNNKIVCPTCLLWKRPWLGELRIAGHRVLENLRAFLRVSRTLNTLINTAPCNYLPDLLHHADRTGTRLLSRSVPDRNSHVHNNGTAGLSALLLNYYCSKATIKCIRAHIDTLGRILEITYVVFCTLGHNMAYAKRNWTNTIMQCAC